MNSHYLSPYNLLSQTSCFFQKLPLFLTAPSYSFFNFSSCLVANGLRKMIYALDYLNFHYKFRWGRFHTILSGTGQAACWWWSWLPKPPAAFQCAACTFPPIPTRPCLRGFSPATPRTPLSAHGPKTSVLGVRLIGDAHWPSHSWSLL